MNKIDLCVQGHRVESIDTPEKNSIGLTRQLSKPLKQVGA